MICKICSSTKVRKLNLNFNYFNEKFSISYCLDCEAGTTFPFLPAVILKKYYITGHAQDNLSDKKNKILIFLRNVFVIFFVIRKIKNFFPSKKNILLDFGCGDGYLGLSLKKHFKKIYFSDFQKKNNNLHIPKKNLFYISLNKIFNSKKKFDFIILRHVLEHVSNPKNVIHKLSKLLNKNGKILIESPKLEINSFWIRALKENYYQFVIPFHLYHFSKKSIEKLFYNKFRIKFFKHSQFILAPSINQMFFNKQTRSLENSLLWILLIPLEFLINFFTKQDNCILAILEKK
jgi:2-polyprenyl-3-methyl-5-hydroxy-6-metoxy-1,4-benzoquinol methylase